MSKTTKQKTNSNEESLLNKIKQLEADNFLLSSPQGLTTVGPLPSTSGGNATPANTTTSTPVTTNTTTSATTPVATSTQPTFTSSASRQSVNHSETRPMNVEERARIEAENAAEIARVDNINSQLPAEMKRLNDSFRGHPKSMYDRAGVAQMYELSPAMPLPAMPRLKEVPNLVTGTFSDGYSNYDKNTTGGGHKPPEPELQVYSLVADDKGNLTRTMQKPEDASSPLTFQDNYGNAKVDLSTGIYSFARDVFPESESSIKGYEIEVPANIWDGSKFVPNPKQPKMNIQLTGNVPKDLARLTKILVAEEMRGKDFANGWLNPQVGANPGGMTIHAANMQGKFGKAYSTVWTTASDKAMNILGLKRTGVVPGSYMDKALAKNTEYQNSKNHSKKQRWTIQERNEIEKMITGTLKAEGLGQM